MLGAPQELCGKLGAPFRILSEAKRENELGVTLSPWDLDRSTAAWFAGMSRGLFLIGTSASREPDS